MLNKLPEDELDFDESEDDSDEEEEADLGLVESEDNQDELQLLEFEWFNVFCWFVGPVQALYACWLEP